MKEFIKSKLSEAMGLHEKKKKPTEEGGCSQYQKIQGLLSNDIFNH